jgi:type IV pilus assembly protein PilM
MYDYDEIASQEMDSLTDYDVILNVGTDASEIVVTNGVGVWLRNIPVGGNLFTKALTKQMKLTFSNAEHIKRNTETAQDPKAVLVAMKTVFNDMLTEVDRSLNFFRNLNKRAKIRRVYALGNAMKLPGLRQYLAKSLDLEFVVPTQYPKMRGAEALSNNVFRDNVSSFAVAYGLALQMLDEAPLNVNLVPRDIVTLRLIERKKPWALAAASLVGLGLTTQYFLTSQSYNVVHGNKELQAAQSTAESVTSKSKDLIAKASAAVTEFKKFDDIGQNLTSGVEGRITWMELLKAINTAIPAEAPNKEILSEGVSAMKREAIHNQNRVYVNNIEVQDLEDLSEWFELVRKWYYIDDVEATWFDIDAEGKSLLPEEGADANADADAGTSSSSGSAASTAPVEKPSLEEMFGFVPKADTKGGSGTSSSSSGSKSSSSSSKSSSSSSSKSSSSSSKSSSSSSSKSSGGASSGGAADELQELGEFTEAIDQRLELIPGPTGPGKIVQLTGYHYHNSEDANDPMRGPEYLRRTLLFNLKHGEIDLPISLERQRSGETGVEQVTLKEMGIYYPVLIPPYYIDDQFRLLDPQAAAEARMEIMSKTHKQAPGASNRFGGMGGAGGMSGGMGGMSGGMGGMGGMSGMSGMSGGMGAMNNQIASQLSPDKILQLNRFDFILQFVWMETPPSDRDARRRAAEEAKLAEAGGTTADADAGSTAAVDVVDTTAPATPADSTAAPVDATATPADPAAAPADATATPADPTAAPADASATPVDPAAAPADATAAPVDPAAAPADPAAAPADPAAAPADPAAAAPVDPAAAPAS